MIESGSKSSFEKCPLDKMRKCLRRKGRRSYKNWHLANYLLWGPLECHNLSRSLEAYLDAQTVSCHLIPLTCGRHPNSNTSSTTHISDIMVPVGFNELLVETRSQICLTSVICSENNLKWRWTSGVGTGVRRLSQLRRSCTLLDL